MLLSILFLVVCLAFLCFYMAKKHSLLSYIGGGFWFLFVIYEYFNGVGWDVHRGFALMGTLLAIVSWVIPLTWRISSVEEEPEEEEYIASINRQRDEIIAGASKSKRKEEW